MCFSTDCGQLDLKEFVKNIRKQRLAAFALGWEINFRSIRVNRINSDI